MVSLAVIVRIILVELSAKVVICLYGEFDFTNNFTSAGVSVGLLPKIKSLPVVLSTIEKLRLLQKAIHIISAHIGVGPQSYLFSSCFSQEANSRQKANRGNKILFIPS